MDDLLKSHWAGVDRCDGTRLARGYGFTVIPQGWVVDGKFPTELREKIQAKVIPIRIGGWHLIARYHAHKYLNQFREKYPGDIVVLMVPCDEARGGLFTSPILVEDLFKSGKTLMNEVVKAQKTNNKILEGMKACAYMAVTGHDDMR